MKFKAIRQYDDYKLYLVLGCLISLKSQVVIVQKIIIRGIKNELH
jgi:hypothetical protein